MNFNYKVGQCNITNKKGFRKKNFDYIWYNNSDDMKTALIQARIDWSDIRKNGERAEKAVRENPGADLYILPEMFSTGFNGICEKDPACHNC